MTQATGRELHAPEGDWAGRRMDRLHHAARVMCASREDAEDLVQETFARVLRRPRVIHSDDELGYLLRVLRNTYVSELRLRARRPRTHPVGDLDLDTEVRGGPDARLAEAQILLSVSTLPPAFREVVVAIDLVGLSYGEAANALRVREGTVKSRLHRARRALAPQLLP